MAERQDLNLIPGSEGYKALQESLTEKKEEKFYETYDDEFIKDVKFEKKLTTKDRQKLRSKNLKKAWRDYKLARTEDVYEDALEKARKTPSPYDDIAVEKSYGKIADKVFDDSVSMKEFDDLIDTDYELEF